MKNTAGEQYGIDEAEIARLLDVFSITAEDEKQVASLQPILSKRAEQVADAFYEYLFRFQELGPLISGEGRLSRLRRAFVRYIATLGQEARKAANSRTARASAGCTTRLAFLPNVTLQLSPRHNRNYGRFFARRSAIPIVPRTS